MTKKKKREWSEVSFLNVWKGNNSSFSNEVHKQKGRSGQSRREKEGKEKHLKR